MTRLRLTCYAWRMRSKMVHFWNVNTASRLQSLETRSQVTSIVFNPYAREFLTTHGLPDMHFAIHTFPNFGVVADVPKAHDTRILHSALSPDGCIVVTASSDENLKFVRFVFVFFVPI